MTEKCPLFRGEHRIGNIPHTCLHNCGPIWDEATSRQQGILDWYGVEDTEDCVHERHGVEHSHEGLHKPDDSSRREYATVDQCEGCRTELMETGYLFECPYN